jgi:hypothetical protein
MPANLSSTGDYMASLIIQRPAADYGPGWRARIRPLDDGYVACLIRTNPRPFNFNVWPSLADCLEWLQDDHTIGDCPHG